MNYKYSIPNWLYDYLGISIPNEGDEIDLSGQNFIFNKGILRNQLLLSNTQAQTEETFGFKWEKRNTFDSEASLARVKSWLIERYGDVLKSNWLN